MKSIFLVLVFSIFLFSCSSTNEKKSSSVNYTYTTEISNNMKITFDDEGNFKEIISIASAPIPLDISLAKNSAIVIATMLARRNISEFLNVEITSENFVENISNTLDNNNNQDKTLNQKTAHKLKDNISTRSRSILKGSYVKETIVVDNRVTVTVISTNRINNKMKEIKDAISL